MIFGGGVIAPLSGRSARYRVPVFFAAARNPPPAHKANGRRTTERLTASARAAVNLGNSSMLEFVLVVHLAKTDAMHNVHAYERRGEATLSGCEHDRDEITTKMAVNKPGAVLSVWREPDTPTKR